MKEFFENIKDKACHQRCNKLLEECKNKELCINPKYDVDIIKDGIEEFCEDIKKDIYDKFKDVKDNREQIGKCECLIILDQKLKDIENL